jgi:hypothetical protein
MTLTSQPQQHSSSTASYGSSTLPPPNLSGLPPLSRTTSRTTTPTGEGYREKEGGNSTDGSIREGMTAPSKDENEYPTGWAFVFIIVALVLSIFLISLDMVNHPLNNPILPP